VIDERSRQVLCAVIQSYIENPDPVGSRYVTKKYKFGYSPATIRNIMADLEEMGFLSQPHTSAGRIPTDKGYRYYVENLLGRSVGYDKSLDGLLSQKSYELTQDMDAILDMTTDVLSRLSHCLGIAISPGAEGSVLRRIELLPYKDNRIAVILLTDEGIIKHKSIKNEFSFTQSDLNRIARYFNREFSGYTINEIRDHLVKELMRDKERFDSLMERALHIYRDVLDDYGSNVFITGFTRILDQPEFVDLETIKDLSKTIEDRHLLIKLIVKIMDSEGVRVVIGSENPLTEMRTMSVIASTYREGDRPAGVIGIIGPKRMNYPSSIALVETAAQFLTKIFIEGGKEWKKEI
jgi:heat-inducible transcriptional repressor